MSTILYIDDTSDQRAMVVMMFSGVGIQVETASDGVEGLRKLEQNPPDLVLLDLRMPKINGFEFLKIVKNRPETADIPVIVVSAWAGSSHVDEALEAGACDFIKKPYELEELISLVQKHLP